MTKLKALQSFSGPDGDHDKDAVFSVPEDRAQFLIDGGYAERTATEKTPVETSPIANPAKRKT